MCGLIWLCNTCSGYEIWPRQLSYFKWCYDQIFYLDLLGVSHRIQSKNKNAVYRLQMQIG